MAIAALLVVAATFTSCKKEYTCECTVNGVVTSTSTIKDTKKKATDACEAKSNTTLGIETTCKIK